MYIVKIDPYDKRRDKVLFEEGLVLLFYKRELRTLGLSEGMEVTEEMYAGRILPLLTKRAKERIVYILKDRDKPEREIRRKLKEGFYPEEAADSAIDWAISKHYIDDRRYAENYIRYHGEGKSSRKLMFDLTAKGIDRELIKELLEDEELAPDETEAIEKELRKRRYDPDDPDPKARQRTFAALARKGFSPEMIFKAMGGERD